MELQRVPEDVLEKARRIFSQPWRAPAPGGTFEENHPYMIINRSTGELLARFSTLPGAARTALHRAEFDENDLPRAEREPIGVVVMTDGRITSWDLEDLKQVLTRG